MNKQLCARCGANLRVETRGDLHDKVLACSHCGYEYDIPDEVTIETEEDGKRVRIHRRDLSGVESRAILDDADMQDKILEATGASLGALLQGASSAQITGKRFSTTTTSRQTLTGDAALQELAKMGVDPFQLDQSSPAPSPKSARRSRIVFLFLFLLLGLGAVSVAVLYVLFRYAA